VDASASTGSDSRGGATKGRYYERVGTWHVRFLESALTLGTGQSTSLLTLTRDLGRVA